MVSIDGTEGGGGNARAVGMKNACPKLMVVRMVSEECKKKGV
jgi:hypothetical protein